LNNLVFTIPSGCGKSGAKEECEKAVHTVCIACFRLEEILEEEVGIGRYCRFLKEHKFHGIP
jgi:hypothetical protein